MFRTKLSRRLSEECRGINRVILVREAGIRVSGYVRLKNPVESKTIER
jgi:hypothetical protein